MNPPVITAYTLRYLAACERRVWLDQYGDVTARERPTPEYASGGIEHEQRIVGQAFGPVITVPVASWPEMLRVTQKLMRQGAAGIRGAAFEHIIELPTPVCVRGRVDWLRRVSVPSGLGNWSYEAIEIKQRAALQAEDRLQLDLYLWLVGMAQEREPAGWFWLGRDADYQPLQVIEHDYSENRLLTVLKRAAEVIAAAEAPPIFLHKSCDLCPWHSACEQTATAQHDIALLPGLSRLTWEHLHRAGLHQLEHILENTPDDLRRIKGIGRTRALDMLAFAEAVIQQMPVMRGSLPEAARSPGVMLDLETRLDDGQVWCFGWQGADGRFRAAIVDRYFEGDELQLPDGHGITIIENSDVGWRLVAEAAQQLPGPVYHWGNFEKGVLRATAPADVIELLDTRLHDLNRTFKQTCMLPVRGTSIKKVAPYLGFHWPEGSNVFAAWGDYNVWLRDGNAAALARACAYNRADVEALAIIWQWLMDNSP